MCVVSARHTSGFEERVQKKEKTSSVCSTLIDNILNVSHPENMSLNLRLPVPFMFFNVRPRPCKLRSMACIIFPLTALL